MGRASQSHRRRLAHFLLRSRRVFLDLVVSSAGALADSSSYEISSRYRSSRASEVPASPVAINTSWSGLQSPESVVATLVGVCSSSFGASGVPS
jgi:hypothetical protein